MVALLCVLYKPAHHLFAGVEVGNHAVSQRTYYAVIVVGFFVRQLCRLAHLDHFVAVSVKSYNGWLVNNNFVIADDDCVGSSEVHCQFLGE